MFALVPSQELPAFMILVVFMPLPQSCNKQFSWFFSKWLQILSWLLMCDCILMSYRLILCFGPLHWFLTKFVNSKGFFLNDWGCSAYLLYINVSVSWCFRGKEGGICVWKAFGVAEGTRMLQFNYFFWGYIGITLSVCSPFRPSMYLVNATPTNPFNGFWWNFMKVGHHM
jgi:hypothetical protein